MQIYQAFALTCGYAMFCGHLARRPHFVARLVASLVVELACAILLWLAIVSNTIDSTLGAPTPLGTLSVGITIYTLLVLVSMIPLAVCFDIPWNTVWFVGIAGLTVYNVGSCLNTLVCLIDPGTLNFVANGQQVNLKMLAALLIPVLIVYFVVWKIFVPRFTFDSEFLVGRTSVLMLVIASMFINVWVGLIYGILVEHQTNPTGVAVQYTMMIVADVLLLCLQFGMFTRSKAEEQLIVVQHLWSQAKQQYELSRENIEEINIKCHDLKHRILALQTKGDPADLTDIADSIAIYDSSIDTGSEPLNVILTEKSLYCQRNCIQLACIADGQALSFVDVADLYVLFGNLVDNAIEAAMKVDDIARRYVRVDVREEQSFVLIETENCYEGTLAFEGGLPQTSKEDARDHGFGMLSIRQIVDKYEGELTVTANEQIFSVSIILPKPKAPR